MIWDLQDTFNIASKFLDCSNICWIYCRVCERLKWLKIWNNDFKTPQENSTQQIPIPKDQRTLAPTPRKLSTPYQRYPPTTSDTLPSPNSKIQNPSLNSLALYAAHGRHTARVCVSSPMRLLGRVVADPAGAMVTLPSRSVSARLPALAAASSAHAA